MTNHRSEENILNDAAAGTAAGCGEEVKTIDNNDCCGCEPVLHRCVTSGSSEAPHDTSCEQANNQAPPPSSDSAAGVTMAPHHRQALAHLYHSSRRSRNYRSVPSSPSTYYAQGQDDKKLLHQDELKKDVTIIQDTPAQDESSSKVADVEWSFDIASLVDDDCSTVSSFDGEESFMDEDIFRVQSDCVETKVNISIGGPVSSYELHSSVEERSTKRLRTA